mgnify:CR=1 FL=1
MNYKKRVMEILEHHQPNRVPVDYRLVPEVNEILLEKFQLNNKVDLLKYTSCEF